MQGVRQEVRGFPQELSAQRWRDVTAAHPMAPSSPPVFQSPAEPGLGRLFAPLGTELAVQASCSFAPSELPLPSLCPVLKNRRNCTFSR